MDINELAAQIEPEIMASPMISESDYSHWRSGASFSCTWLEIPIRARRY